MTYSCGRTHITHRRRLGSSTPVLKKKEELHVPSHEEIAALAYSYWEKRGFQGGSALEDWLRAERELKLA
jgi:hypothetical protein